MELKINQSNITSQELLRQVESLCVQDEPPFCAAACPLGIDARAMNALIKAGDFDGAYTGLMKAAPFMRIVAYTCPQPCKSACKRAGLGGAVEINLLERAVIEACDKAPKAPLLLPKKPAAVGIVGGGLRGMSAAWSLSKKGYRVTIFEAAEKLGGTLWDMASLPRQVLERDIDALLKYPVEVRYNSPIVFEESRDLAAFAAEHGLDALYLASGLPDSIPAGDDGVIGAAVPAVGHKSREAYSSVGRVYAGRQASITLDRLIQAVSLHVGREKEGVVSTRLYTNTRGIPPEAAIRPAQGGYSRQEAAAEAARCLECACMECVRACPFMQKYGAYPKKYVREVYNNLSIAMGAHQANGMINTCAACGQCGAICPNGLDMREMFLAARRHMNDSGKMPPSTFEFALLDMEYSMSQACFLVQPPPGGGPCEYLFFPGCQMGASEPRLVGRLYQRLLARYPDNVGLMLSCCGIMALWAGDSPRFDAAIGQITNAYNALGRPRVVTGCLNCAQTLKTHCGIDALGVWEVLSGGDTDSGGAHIPQKLALRHACGGRYQPDLFAKISSLAAALGYQVTESRSALLAQCCGYGGLLAFTDTELSQAFADDTPGDDTPLLTYCINCRDMLLRCGKEAYYLPELLVPASAGLNRTYPTWSQRQENRSGLKIQLLREIWGQTVQQCEKTVLYYSDALMEKLEREHILLSDISAAVEAAEKSGDKFKKPHNTFLAYYRPRNVTFWVEYTPKEAGYEIINAYTHRMDFSLTNPNA